MSGLLKRLAECSLIVPKLGGKNVSVRDENNSNLHDVRLIRAVTKVKKLSLAG